MPSAEKLKTPQPVLELVERFDRNREAYKSGSYNETQLRREFLDPLFKALGWDMDNDQGYAEAYKDVIHEDAIKVGEATKAPDYCFRIGGARKFFLEAKRPSVDIKHDVSPAFQLRRYAWTTKLPLSILTDFEEFAVYDCRVKPDQNDTAAVARILYLSYTEYAERWNEIAGVFSRNAVLKGSFDKFAESTKTKRGTADVDDEFLKTIETWRSDLARNLALRNPKLTQRELNFAVQRIIDRIVFLRIGEGRGIEDYGRLRALTNGDRIYPRLCQMFEQADERYNSGLFHFKPEEGRHEAPDELTLGLEVDDKLLRDILKSIYYPESPYVFSALPADILGQVYEQFLGKVIRLTAGHHAVVEEKPEVKKAGGVYYTPAYIVDYIVQNTLGKLLEEIVSGGRAPSRSVESPGKGNQDASGASPSRVLRRISQVRILDPACGSGSFLLGAYEHLLNWHLDFYANNDPAKWARGNKPVLVQTSSGWKLTIAERKRILLDNIYGVDIDTQAVETTKLSLLLKVLEGETQQSLQPVLRMFQERALPDLGANIKCGNSLIGPDFYQQQQMTLLDDEERYRVNVFDWQAEFPDIFRRKVAAGEMRETPASPLDYTMPGVPLHGSYSYKKKKVEKAVQAVAPAEPESEGGFDAVIGNPPYGMLQPHNTDEPVLAYLRKNYVAAKFKMELFHMFLQRGVSLLKEGGHHGHIVPTTIQNNVYAEILRSWLMERCCIENISVARGQVFAHADVHTSVIILRREGDAKKRARHEILTTSELGEEFAKSPKRLSRTQQRTFGKLPGKVWNILVNERNASLITRLTEEFSKLKMVGTINRGLITGARDKFFSREKKSKAYVPIIAGGDVQRYFTARPSEYVLFERPHTAGGCWDKEVHLAPHKIVVRQIGLKPTASILLEPIAVTGNIFTVRAESVEQELYILGLFNSRLTDFFWRIMFADFKSSFPQVTIFSLDQVPIRVINFSDRADQSRHDQMVKLVERMLELHRSLAAARTPPEKTSLERQIAATDAQIDRLVYDLYGLTEEEVKIVEEGIDGQR